mmetsp:Transcript_29645/g.85279  ORF Transcript_29645/g.85279 Transcript_29645/m.85279 type:complete len:145 (+) Transcript_29645:126-560(+)
MAPYTRECQVNASPSTIWAACFEPMKWELWDPDVSHLEDISGDLVAGTSLVFVMKDGPIPKIPVVLKEVEKNRRIQYEGSVWKGTMKFFSTIEITEVNKTTCNVRYSFDMHGIVGSTINWLNPKPVSDGVDKGIENIKRLSEEA